MRNIALALCILVLLFTLLTNTADAHRSGCHRWHSCPSDTGKYVCGDIGYCSQCPDNKYCKDGKARSMRKDSAEDQENTQGNTQEEKQEQQPEGN